MIDFVELQNEAMNEVMRAPEIPTTPLAVARILRKNKTLAATDWATWIALIITILQVIAEFRRTNPQSRSERRCIVCMEDVKIWRNLRRKIVNRALSVGAAIQRLVGPNPDRIALHIYGTATFGQDIRLWDGAPTTSANIIATYCPSAWVETQLSVYDGGGVSPQAYPVPIRPWIPHIKDYGDALTGELWIDSFAGTFTVSVWELILDARTAAQLKGTDHEPGETVNAIASEITPRGDGTLPDLPPAR